MRTNFVDVIIIFTKGVGRIVKLYEENSIKLDNKIDKDFFIACMKKNPSWKLEQDEKTYFLTYFKEDDTIVITDEKKKEITKQKIDEIDFSNFKGRLLKQ